MYQNIFVFGRKTEVLNENSWAWACLAIAESDWGASASRTREEPISDWKLLDSLTATQMPLVLFTPDSEEEAYFAITLDPIWTTGLKDFES
ncbi:hypothetical protein VNO77_20502 [Canavalia gladiata]|uniref:Uncharacterized protein n=1 Tax=Canavalia gladiata TaxID=3824 RepID=A0AAN9QMH5_CANGL